MIIKEETSIEAYLDLDTVEEEEIPFTGEFTKFSLYFQKTILKIIIYYQFHYR